MKKVDITQISNEIVLQSEENEEFEGICGTERGILWEDSLEQFFIANEIELIEYKDYEWILLGQGDKIVRFQMFEGKEGSSYPAEHIDFRKAIR